MDFVDQVHIFGLTSIHTYGSNIKLIRLFSLIFNYAKPQILTDIYKSKTKLSVNFEKKTTTTKDKKIKSHLIRNHFDSFVSRPTPRFGRTIIPDVTTS